MTMPDYLAIMSRITPHRADEVDDLLARFERHSVPRGQEVFPPLDAAPLPEPRFKREDAICVGFRVARAAPDAAQRAIRLAALALERDVDIVILSEDGLSGFERFGFRTERVPAAATSRPDWIRQVSRFWGLDKIF